MGKTEKLLINISIFGISSFASKIFIFLMLPFYTTFLSTAEYGIADMTISLVYLFVPIFCIHIYSAVMRFSIENINNAKVIFINGFTVLLVGSFILLFFYPVLTSSLLGEYVNIFYVFFFSYALYTFLSSYARGVQKIKAVGISGVINTVCMALFNILFLAVFKWGVYGYLSASILGHLISSAMLFFLLREYITFKMSYLSASTIKELVKYSVPLAPNSTAWWGVSSANKIIIQKYIDNNVLGLYSVACKFPSIISVIQDIVSQGVTLTILDGYDKNEPNDNNDYYSKLYDLYSLSSIFIVSFIIVISKLLATLLFAGDFVVAWKFVPIMCIPSLWGGLSGFLGTFYAASKHNSGMFISTLLGAVISILISFFGVPHYGVVAIFIANIVAYFVIWLYRLIDTKKFVKLDYYLLKHCICWILLLLLSFLTLYVNNALLLNVLNIAVLMIIVIINFEAIIFFVNLSRSFLKSKLRI